MHVEAIQDDDQLAPQRPMKPAQKLDDIGGHDVAVVELPVGIEALPVGRKSYRADGRQAIVPG